MQQRPFLIRHTKLIFVVCKVVDNYLWPVDPVVTSEKLLTLGTASKTASAKLLALNTAKPTVLNTYIVLFMDVLWNQTRPEKNL